MRFQFYSLEKKRKKEKKKEKWQPSEELCKKNYKKKRKDFFFLSPSHTQRHVYILHVMHITCQYTSYVNNFS